MMFVYGARFLDMWEGVDVNDMQATWTEALRGMKRDDLQRGVAAMYNAKYPPTLPEFIALCAPPAPVPLAHQYRIESAVERTDSATARARLAEIAGTVTQYAPVTATGIAWARRIVDEAKVHHVPAQRLGIALEAIRNWEVLNRPRERQPGDDDEPQGAAA
jgi:hypothetical protein